MHCPWHSIAETVVLQSISAFSIHLQWHPVWFVCLPSLQLNRLLWVPAGMLSGAVALSLGLHLSKLHRNHSRLFIFLLDDLLERFCFGAAFIVWMLLF